MNYTKLKNKLIDRSQITRLDLTLINLINDLKFLREDLQISQEDLARSIGVTSQKVRGFEDYEKRPTLEMLEQVENFLQCQKKRS